MKWVLICVEGQTEETFIRDVLAPHLKSYSVHPTARILHTKRTASGNAFKGGVASWAQVEREVRDLLRNTSAALVTTMLDYYGLPSDFPGMADRPKGSSEARVRHVEDAFAAAINHARFLPFLVLHEFEALLFAAPEHIGDVLGDPTGSKRLLREVAGMAPEAVNDGNSTHPAARILRCFGEYQKRLHGPRIAARIGLSAIRQRCPHFDAWVSRLEKLGSEGNEHSN